MAAERSQRFSVAPINTGMIKNTKNSVHVEIGRSQSTKVADWITANPSDDRLTSIASFVAYRWGRWIDNEEPSMGDYEIEMIDESEFVIHFAEEASADYFRKRIGGK